VSFVLDTNLVSEIRKPRPDQGVIEWHTSQDAAHLFITTITLAEAWQGFHSLRPNHPDHGRIKAFVTDLPRQYRVLNFDARAAAIWSRIAAQATGPLPLRDSLIVAIALSRGFRVVTRDTGPFQRVGCKVLSPWT
jgi:toxin FitB